MIPVFLSLLKHHVTNVLACQKEESLSVTCPEWLDVIFMCFLGIFKSDINLVIGNYNNLRINVKLLFVFAQFNYIFHQQGAAFHCCAAFLNFKTNFY